ncbi:transcription-repair-coupling factor [Striga asiatica]|uniref:Transcription-repair-coupling factor n=1 Tax=Striga asiatica TaxID=4170 RepID=A0A5A7Q453_STRAF|nr:transcription-repair-coupling factor [Striga asiatica]
MLLDFLRLKTTLFPKAMMFISQWIWRCKGGQMRNDFWKQHRQGVPICASMVEKCGVCGITGIMLPQPVEETKQRVVPREASALMESLTREPHYNFSRRLGLALLSPHAMAFPGPISTTVPAGSLGIRNKQAHAYLFYPDKSLLSHLALERLAALEECRDLGQGFQLAERDMGIRGFGNIFGEQQTGDVGNVGIDLFFEMLFESLSMFDLDLNPHLPSEYINHMDNPLEIINEAENADQRDIWNLVLFTEDLRRHYGKEPYSMEILLKKLYIRRMAADLGITEIYTSGKMVGMKTSMSEKVFKMMKDSMPSETHRSSIVFEDGSIKAELLLELPREQLLEWIFRCLAELYASLPALIKY